MAKPTHILKVLSKSTDHRVEAGVGWLNADGSISISLNPAICLQPNPDHVITLFPAKYRPAPADVQPGE